MTPELGGWLGTAWPELGGGQATWAWLSSGIAFAVWLKCGRKVWPGVVLGTFLIELSVHKSTWLALLLALGDSLGSLLAAELLAAELLAVDVLRRRDRPIRLDERGDVGRFGVFGLGVAASVAAANATVWLAVTGTIRWADAPLVGLAGWLGSAAGVLVAGVLLLVGRWAAPLAANQRRWQQALDDAGVGTADWHLSTGRIRFSRRWTALLDHGTAPDGHGDANGAGAGDVAGVDDANGVAAFWSRLHPDDLAPVQRGLDSLRAASLREKSPEATSLQGMSPQDAPLPTTSLRQLDPAAACRVDCRMRGGDGAWRWFELRVRVSARNATGEPARLLCSLRDITFAHAERDERTLWRGVFEQLDEGLLITDAGHRVVEVNAAFLRMTGQRRDELIGQVPALLAPVVSGRAPAAGQAAMLAGLAAHGTWRGELPFRARDGETRLLQLAASALSGSDGSPRGHLLAVTDITQARQQRERLERHAHFDELTRLPNRVRLSQMLQTALQTSRREGTLLTVCYLDLDHFKPVNDRYGHDAGDRLLVELAERMRRSLRSWAAGDDVVARIGGDEFALLLRTTTVEESRHAVGRVLNQLAQPCALDAGSVAVTASIGATVFPLDSADADTLLRHADHAMYGAKQAGRNGYLFFDAEHDRRTEARFVALGRVQEALDAEELRLHFQPKADMRSGRVVGVEALLRWKHPEHGVISPAQFLPLIENTGLSTSVGNWVLQHGIAQLARWLQMGLDITVSINVSARHLQEPLFGQHLAALLARHEEPVARHLIIEVLETAALADIDYTCALMQACRALGVRFALDDFGTGYSTFTYLKRLPIDMLKIDRSFVINMLADHEDLAIVEGVIGLSKTFGCAVVAEGVETAAQARRLIEIGCDVGQGNGIAAPMPPERLPDWIRGYTGISSPANEALAS